MSFTEVSNGRIIGMMIHNLKGKITLKRDTFIVIDVQGVGYKIFTSVNTISKVGGVGGDADILTHLHVREDELSLFGFLDGDELDLFESLISVSGIGPKSAMNIMSIASPERISAAISGGEIELLQKVSGIGRKMAERIILELKDKIKSGTGGAATIKVMESDSDVYEALTSMGYSTKQAKNAISKVGKDVEGTSDRLKAALRIIKS